MGMPAVLLIFPQIFIEQIAQFIRRYADTVIFNGDDNILAIVAAKDADFAALDLGVYTMADSIFNERLQNKFGGFYLSNAWININDYEGIDRALASDPRTDVRIFGKPSARVNRRMGIVVGYAPLGDEDVYKRQKRDGS